MRIGFVLGVVLAALTAGGASADMALSFRWGPTRACLDPNSPPIRVSGLPKGTVALRIRMRDMDAPEFNHGTASVAVSGDAALPYGAFLYRGPCPAGRHTYRITAEALDNRGYVVGKASASRPFPE